MQERRWIVIWMLIPVLLLQACGGAQLPEGAVETSIFQTQQISALQTAAAGGGGGEAGEEEASESPTITTTPTPDVPLISVSQNTNCRTGPSVSYGFVTTVNPSQVMEVVGLWDGGSSYVVVANPNGSGNCWLWTQYADKTDFSAYDLPTFSTPPTPTPTLTPTQAFDWNGTWTSWLFGFQYTISITQAGNTITGSFPYGAESVNMIGTLSANNQIATGTWEVSDGSDSGTFQLMIKAGNPNQYIGNGDSGSFDWCGARSGASQPSPCMWP